ncbi:MAG: hypothetical protein FWF73_06420 [Spirochaetes bacterium]|nr:hypothetical protein [Spirochaetota bacterium]
MGILFFTILSCGNDSGNGGGGGTDESHDKDPYPIDDLFQNFVAVSNGYKTAYSHDGTSWISPAMPSSSIWNSVCYGGD